MAADDLARVERVATRLLTGAPSNDEWFVENGYGTPEQRWERCPEEDRRHWREYARAVLAQAALPPSASDAAVARVLALCDDGELGEGPPGTREEWVRVADIRVALRGDS